MPKLSLIQTYVELTTQVIVRFYLIKFSLISLQPSLWAGNGRLGWAITLPELSPKFLLGLQVRLRLESL